MARFRFYRSSNNNLPPSTGLAHGEPAVAADGTLYVGDSDGNNQPIAGLRSPKFFTPQSLTIGTTATLDLRRSSFYSLNLTQNTTLAFSNFPSWTIGCSFDLLVSQDSTGNRTLILPIACTLTGSVSLTASTKTLLKFVSLDGGNNWDVVATQLSSNVFSSAKIWLDAESLLADLSGNGNTTSQSDSTRMPTYQTSINSKSVWRFDGLNDGLETNLILNPQSNTTLTMYVVLRRNAANSGIQSLLSFDGTTGGYQRALSISNNIFQIQTGNGTWEPSFSSVPASTNYLAIVEYSPTNIRFWVNGTLYSRGSAEQVNNNAQPLWVGFGHNRNYTFDGDIASAVVATAARNANIESYLKSKYGFSY